MDPAEKNLNILPHQGTTETLETTALSLAPSTAPVNFIRMSGTQGLARFPLCTRTVPPRPRERLRDGAVLGIRSGSGANFSHQPHLLRDADSGVPPGCYASATDRHEDVAKLHDPSPRSSAVCT